MYGYGEQYWKYLGTQINFMTFYYIEIETKLKRNWNELFNVTLRWPKKAWLFNHKI